MDTHQRNEYDLRVVLYRDGETWIAQCLEHDISTQAADLSEVLRRLLWTLDAEAEDRPDSNQAFSGIDAAPPWCFELFDNAGGSYVPFESSARGMHLKLAA